MSVQRLKVVSKENPMKYLLFAFLTCLPSVRPCAGGEVWHKGDPLPLLNTWPKLTEVVLTSSVATNNSMFSYYYTLYNPIMNKVPIAWFDLDLRIIPEQHPFSYQDITLQHQQMEHMRILRDAMKVFVINASAPLSWDSSKNSGEMFDGRWGVLNLELEDKQLLMPGKRLSGFTLGAKEPPGIREFIALGWSYEFYYGIDRLSPDEFNFYYNSDEYTTETSKGIEYLGKTIAPVTPPEPFSVSSWTIKMAEYATEARKQKWIKTDKTLVEVKKIISALNIDDKDKLEAAVRKIESYVLAEKKKGNLTDEADALVRLNAQYLLQRIKER